MAVRPPLMTRRSRSRSRSPSMEVVKHVVRRPKARSPSPSDMEKSNSPRRGRSRSRTRSPEPRAKTMPFHIKEVARQMKKFLASLEDKGATSAELKKEFDGVLDRTISSAIEILQKQDDILIELDDRDQMVFFARQHHQTLCKGFYPGCVINLFRSRRQAHWIQPNAMAW
jgi:hypothetical protein